jgi:hypothetical protein
VHALRVRIDGALGVAALDVFAQELLGFELVERQRDFDDAVARGLIEARCLDVAPYDNRHFHLKLVTYLLLSIVGESWPVRYSDRIDHSRVEHENIDEALIDVDGPDVRERCP